VKIIVKKCARKKVLRVKKQLINVRKQSFKSEERNEFKRKKKKRKNFLIYILFNLNFSSNDSDYIA
jgi:hypothetical protein